MKLDIILLLTFQVFDANTVTIYWTSEVRIGVDAAHTTLLCSEAGKACYKKLRQALGITGKVGVGSGSKWNFEQISSRLEDPKPGLLLLLGDPNNHRNLNELTRFLQNEIRLSDMQTLVFVFKFRIDDYRANSIRAMFKVFVIQAISYLLPRTEETDRPGHVFEALNRLHSLGISQISDIFNAVNVWFAGRRFRPLINCCKLTEPNPAILLVTLSNDWYSSFGSPMELRKLKLEDLGDTSLYELSASNILETKGTMGLVLQKYNAQDIAEIDLDWVPRNRQFCDIISEWLKWPISLSSTIFGGSGLHAILNDLKDAEPDIPREQYLFRKILDNIHEEDLQSTVKFLHWVIYTFSNKPLSFSEINIALAFEQCMEKQETAVKGYLFERKLYCSQITIEKIMSRLAVMVTFEGGEITFGHPVAFDSLKSWVSQQLGSSPAETHLYILNQLFRCILEEAARLQATKEHSSIEENHLLGSLFDLTSYAARFWPEHYNSAANEDSTRRKAEDSLRNFLVNKTAVEFCLGLCDDSTTGDTTSWSSDTSDPRVFMLAKAGLGMSKITYILKLEDGLSDPETVYSTFLGALKGHGLSSVEMLLPKLELLLVEHELIQTILYEACLRSDPETMTKIFPYIPSEVSIPQEFINRAIDFGN
ncbi:hypothetical protein NHQ30_007115 [Ciborinia camelliae]|nr:hypothetical protein NHQ30_007115 [Ciborinia camelliae]